jgi:polar amino acid transport system permease protein
MNERIKILGIIISLPIVLYILSLTELKKYLPNLIDGAIVTVKVAVLGLILFFIVSFLAGIARGHFKGVSKWIAIIYIETFRGTSLLVILFWLFFVLPEFGILLSPLTAGVLGLGLNYGAYGAEVVRGAVNSVTKGQSEAATALNMTPNKYLTRIVVPQVFVITLPGLTNLAMELIKGTSLVAGITIGELAFAAMKLNAIFFQPIEVFGIALLFYYFFAQFVRLISSYLEDRFSVHLNKEG